ncbi:unnamed protein product [Mycetohabitans rhizoxinica HKI 454]|uniref:Uncharacterized protein n=1 Tax=Mycetohabitans rhizoxinica (strain DSM 19002 / CIP 109453 / HKI 454) TaxID=882378 RepID=E5ARQ8_MYCRK|nr:MULTISPECIES: DUF5908 family protein [Mycetohabitans]MCG1047320.1 hypothetical protein [Mycetohabitans sp. B6]CBW75290.1 unnamed protein product [Mycetohabitans rhizoxinica HKI 454]
MTVEIRQLVIEARVVDDERGRVPRRATPHLNSLEQAQLIDRVVQRVLEALREQQEQV